jgi:hypothetical protein
MKKTLALALAFAGALSVSGCYTPQQQTGTLAGGAIGAGTGALIGNAVTAPRRHCVRWGWDAYGNRFCRAFAYY